MFLIAQIVAVMILAVSGEIETHRLITVKDGVDVSQDIVYDKDRNTVLVTVSKIAGIRCQVATVNLHDFNTNYVVFKDVERGVCFLTHPPIPFATPSIYKMKRTDLILAYSVKADQTLMTNEEVTVLAGENIGGFCQDYETYWMTLTPKGNTDRVKREVNAGGRGCWWSTCNNCFLSWDTGYPAEDPEY